MGLGLNRLSLKTQASALISPLPEPGKAPRCRRGVGVGVGSHLRGHCPRLSWPPHSAVEL